MERVNIDYNLTIDYKKLFGDWTEILSPLFTSNYTYNLMLFIHELYKNNDAIQPKKEEVFEVFKRLSWKDTRVVILGEGPIATPSGGGILFGTNKRFIVAPSRVAVAVQGCIERQIYNGLDFNFDYSMQNWLNQGVLPLHSSFTTERMITNSHTKIWREFTRGVLKGINNNRTGLIFLLLGEDGRYFKDFIDEKNNIILEYHSPIHDVRKYRDWNCPMFSKINSIINKTNGKEFEIKW